MTSPSDVMAARLKNFGQENAFRLWMRVDLFICAHRQFCIQRRSQLYSAVAAFSTK